MTDPGRWFPNHQPGRFGVAPYFASFSIRSGSCEHQALRSSSAQVRAKRMECASLLALLSRAHHLGR